MRLIVCPECQKAFEENPDIALEVARHLQIEHGMEHRKAIELTERLFAEWDREGGQSDGQ